MSQLAYKLPGFTGRFVSQTGRRTKARDVTKGDVVEIGTGRVRVHRVAILPVDRIAFIDPDGRMCWQGREVETVRVWRPTEGPAS